MGYSKWALVTGVSAGGMGEGHVNALLERGINVVATAIDIKLLANLQVRTNTNGAAVVRLQLDVTSPESIASVVEEVKQKTDGRLDFLFNNAGYGYYMPLLDVDLDKARKQYEVNVWGVLAMTQAFFPLLRAARGTVVNQSSMAGVQGFNRP
jgi:NAD(P)-dependent dehydrogenase (short-subunit alcohol dehydrogenase family)